MYATLQYDLMLQHITWHCANITKQLNTVSFVLHCVALRCIVLHCIALHWTVLHCVVLYCIVLRCTVYCIFWDVLCSTYGIVPHSWIGVYRIKIISLSLNRCIAVHTFLSLISFRYTYCCRTFLSKKIIYEELAGSNDSAEWAKWALNCSAIQRGRAM